MAFWLLILLAHSRCDLADELTSMPGLLQRPDVIFTWVGSKDFVIKPFWVFKLESVYWCIMQHLLNDDDNPFSAEFLRPSAKYGKEPLTFVLTCRKPEYVWSCGLNHRSNRLKYHTTFGFNLYGRILSSIYDGWRSGHFTTSIPMSLILNTPDSTGDDFSRTVLLLADSECRQVFGIYNGHVVMRKGAKYHDLARLVVRREIDLRQYKYIIIVCGINHCRNDDVTKWERSWKALERQLSPVLFHDSPHQVILNTPIWNPKAPYVPQHAEWIKARAPQVDNLHICDWSGTDDNPFVRFGRSGRPRIVDEKYVFDRFHINHGGYRALWVHWAKLFPELFTVE